MPKKFALRAHCRQDVCAPSETWRVFCAVDLPNTVRKLIAQRVNTLRSTAPEAHASWSRENNIHLTLKFLGNIQQSDVGMFSQAVDLTVAGAPPFNVRVGQTGVFPQHGQPRVLWIGIEDLAGELDKLHTRLEDESAKVGFAREARSFRPHLTLARLRKPQYADSLAAAHKQMQFEPMEFNVSEVLVIRSELSSAGSKYTVISRHPLQ